MPSLVRKLSAVAAIIAVIAVPTGSIAATTPLPQATTQQASAAATTNPWLTLSAMTGSTSSASAAAAAASQGVSRPGAPPAAPLMVILGTIALSVWILFNLDEGSKEEHVVDDVVDALVPTPQTAISPA